MAVTSISEYLETLSDNGRTSVSLFICFMEEEYPQVHPKISFSMPMWLKGQKMNEGYVAISAAKNHFSIHFSDEDLVQKLDAELPRCKSGKRCINISYQDTESYKYVLEAVKSFF